MPPKVLDTIPDSWKYPEVHFWSNFRESTWVLFRDNNWNEWVWCFPEHPKSSHDIMIDKNNTTALARFWSTCLIIDIEKRKIICDICEVTHYPYFETGIYSSDYDYFIVWAVDTIYIFEKWYLKHTIKTDYGIDGITFLATKWKKLIWKFQPYLFSQIETTGFELDLESLVLTVPELERIMLEVSKKKTSNLLSWFWKFF